MHSLFSSIVPYLLVFRVSTWMNNPIHVQVQIVKLNLIRIRCRRVYWRSNTINLGGPFLKAIHNYRWIFSRKPSEKCWNSHADLRLLAKCFDSVQFEVYCFNFCKCPDVQPCRMCVIEILYMNVSSLHKLIQTVYPHLSILI